jgi:hypothetical protein
MVAKYTFLTLMGMITIRIQLLYYIKIVLLCFNHVLFVYLSSVICLLYIKQRYTIYYKFIFFDFKAHNKNCTSLCNGLFEGAQKLQLHESYLQQICL